MTYDKKKYEKLIYESPLFTLDKERQRSAYRKESLKMVEYLYCYLLAVNAKKNEPYGCEIVDVATRCINGYDKSGDFLHYFNAAWKSEYTHICGDEIIDKKFQGIKLSEQEKRNVKKYMYLFSKCNPQMPDEKKYAKIAAVMELSIKKIRFIAETTETKVTSEYSSNTEGEEESAFAQIPADFSVEEYFSNLSSLKEMLDSVEEAYVQLQKRQKPIISDLLTIKIGMDIFEIEKISDAYSFLSKEVRQQILQTGTVPTQREIAEKYGKNEASISRTINDFLKKIQK